MSDGDNSSDIIVSCVESNVLNSIHTDTQGTLDAIAQHETIIGDSTEDIIQVDSSVPLTQINPTEEDGKFLIVTPGGTATMGVGTLEPLPEVDGTTGEPACKRYRMMGEDGQAYILSVAGDLVEGNTVEDTKLSSEHQYQARQAELASEGAAIKTQDKRSKLLKSYISQAWFTSRDDKNILQSSGATWKQGQWTKDEVDLLQENIAEYCKMHNINDPTEVIFEMTKDDRKQFYRTIARGLQRPLFSVYRRVTRMYDQKNHIGKYSYEEKIKLKELRSKHGNDWATIGQALGRSASSVKDKCRLMKETCNSGKWLPEEEKRLTQAVYDLAGGRPGEDIVHGLSWAAVAEKVITRSEKQCRTKWLNYMNWKMKGGKEWTRAEDMNLIIRVANMGVSDDTQIDWDELARNWKSARSPQWLRGKWWSLKRHIPDYQILPFNELLELMKSHYLHFVRVRNTPNSTARTRKIVSSGQTLQCVPIALSVSGLSTVDGSNLDDLDPSVQAYEVLQELPNSSGQYIIAQSDGTDTLQTSLSEHIIVQTVPISQRKGTDYVRIFMPNCDSEISDQSHVVIRVPSTSDLTDHTGVTSFESSDVRLSVSIDQEQQDLETLTGGNVMTQSASLSDDTSFSTNVLEEAVISSPTDVVIGIKQGSFVQSTSSNGQLMTSFSDPMLNSDSVCLMGPVSDVETELTTISS